MPPILPPESSSSSVPARFNRSCIPAFVLRAGILGVFLFALVVALGSFALFGCRCTQPYVPQDLTTDHDAFPLVTESTPHETKP